MTTTRNLCSILTSCSVLPPVKLKGVLLDDLWVSTGTAFENDYVNILVQRSDKSVVRLRLVGPASAATAGRFGRGDEVQAIVVGEIPVEDVLLVQNIEPADAR